MLICVPAPATLYVTFEAFSKLSDTLINMSSNAEDRKGQRNYDDKHLRILSSRTVKDIIKDCPFVPGF